MASLLILLPFAGVIVLNLFYNITKRNAAFWFAAALFSAEIITAVFYRHLFFGGQDYAGSFLRAKFSIDSLSFIALLSIQITCLASLIVARYTLSDLGQRFNFINLLLIASMGMNGIVMTKDIFSLYVFLEVAAISSFILIAFRRGRASLEGAFKYIIMSAVATVFMLSAIALFLLVSGDTSFSAIRQGMSAAGQSRIILFAAGLFLCGIFIKGGLVPFHGWLPDAYSAAPEPVSVLLAGVLTKICGIYTLIRLTVSVFIMGASFNQLLLLLGTISVLFGAFAALGQKDFKRMLAYSSISQVGYIILGLGSASALGIIGAVFHFFNHAVFKTLLFVNAACVGMRAGTNDMEKMGGLASRMPVSGVTSAAGFLSAAGVPPFAGFWSKLVIIIALWQAGLRSYAAIAIMASVITLAYLLSMQRKVFFGKIGEGLEDIKEASPGLSFVSIALACVILGVGLFFPAVFSLLFEPVRQVIIQ